ncbi:unnamed protein product [Alternaria alternata]
MSEAEKCFDAKQDTRVRQLFDVMKATAAGTSMLTAEQNKYSDSAQDGESKSWTLYILEPVAVLE